MSSVICVICRETDNNHWRALSCGHVLHESCLSTWFQHNPICPQCNRRPNGRALRIYFATQEDSRGHQEIAEEARASAATEPQELEQLRQMLFMEAQERGVAWQQVGDSEKLIVRLKVETSNSRLEIQRLAKELENCQMTFLQREAEAEQVMQVTSQELRDCQLANRKLVETRDKLVQDLRDSQQHVGDLLSALEFQEARVQSASTVQVLHVQAEDEVRRLNGALKDSHSRLELEQQARQLNSVRLDSALDQNEKLAEQIRQLQANFRTLTTEAKDKENEQRVLDLAAQDRMQDAENRTLDALEGLKMAELEKCELKRELARSEQEVLKLKRSSGIPTDTFRPELIFAGVAVGEESAASPDNFSDFPVFDMLSLRPENRAQSTPHLPETQMSSLGSSRSGSAAYKYKYVNSVDSGATSTIYNVLEDETLAEDDGHRRNRKPKGARKSKNKSCRQM